jgi:hypothetical protein
MFGTPICFENSFPELPRAFVRDGAGFLVVTVNNASYGFTAASEQHQQMSQMRAIETGRWVVDAAVSGISAFIDPTGRVVASAGLFEPAILRGTIRSSDERTWYVRLGDWLPWLCLAVVAVLFLMPRRRRHAREAPAPLAAGYRVLVILPTYDEAATIERVLDGVLSAPQHVDVVVVDDSSPDGTARIVRDRAEKEPRIRLIERPAKSGLASAYVEGFRLGLPRAAGDPARAGAVPTVRGASVADQKQDAIRVLVHEPRRDAAWVLAQRVGAFERGDAGLGRVGQHLACQRAGRIVRVAQAREPRRDAHFEPMERAVAQPRSVAEHPSELGGRPQPVAQLPVPVIPIGGRDPEPGLAGDAKAHAEARGARARHRFGTGVRRGRAKSKKGEPNRPALRMFPGRCPGAP